MKRFFRLALAFGLFSSLTFPAVGVADSFHGHWVLGEIEASYLRTGGPGKWGNAVIDESDAARGGRYQDFERDTSFFWHPDVAGGVAHQVGGLIRQRWLELRAERGTLGYPVTDELEAAQGGRFNRFENGSIYWSPGTGAHEISGVALDYWLSQDGERSRFGFPTSGKVVAGFEGFEQRFEHGKFHLVLPTYEQLPVSDRKPHSSYRVVVPLFVMEKEKRHLAPSGLFQHVQRSFDEAFPFEGCPGQIHAGVECELKLAGGRSERVRITQVADDGFVVETLQGSVQGSHRKTVFRFVMVDRNNADGDFRFLHAFQKAAFYQDDQPWVGVEVESFGPVADAQWSGPLNNRRIGAAAWARFGLDVSTAADSYSEVYLVEGIPGLDELIAALKKARSETGKTRSRRSLEYQRTENPGEVVDYELPEQDVVPLEAWDPEMGVDAVEFDSDGAEVVQVEEDEK